MPSSYYPLIHRAYRRFTDFPKSKKAASYFTLTISLISLSFFGLFAIRPTLVTAISLIKNIQDLKKLYTDYETKIGSVVRANTELEQIRSSLPLIDAALPANASFSKLTQAIEKFAQRENFTIIQLQIESAPISTLPPGSKTYSLGFNLVGTGSYPAISAFLSHLINWKRIVRINSLEFIQEGGTDGNLRLSLKATTYYEP